MWESEIEVRVEHTHIKVRLLEAYVRIEPYKTGRQTSSVVLQYLFILLFDISVINREQEQKTKKEKEE